MNDKVTIDLCEGNNTKGQLTLLINDYRIAGIKSGFGYKVIKSWEVNKKDILEALE